MQNIVNRSMRVILGAFVLALSSLSAAATNQTPTLSPVSRQACHLAS